MCRPSEALCLQLVKLTVPRMGPHARATARPAQEGCEMNRKLYAALIPGLLILSYWEWRSKASS